MHIVQTIAIDGPAASGKTTLGKKIADFLGYLFFDTGIMYRAITWLALQENILLTDDQALSRLAEQTDIDVLPPSKADGRAYDIQANGQDITWEIRRPEVDANVSVVSAVAGVRRALTAQQRRIGLRGRVVMAGRDIGTVVLPEAKLKIYLDASVEERARRRTVEMHQRDEIAVYDDILAAMRRRDQIDSSRDLAPLKPAADAVIVNSDGLDAEQIFEQVKKLLSTETLHATSQE
jgi:cytidylate kinase